MEQALAIGIEGASFISAYPHVDAERILARASPGAKLDEAGARLVARREGIRVILAGDIARTGSRYDIGMRVLGAADEKPTAVLKATAGDQGDVLSAVGKLAGRVRTTLGDTAKGADLTAAAETFTAGSLEAVHEYALGQDLLLRRKADEAILHFQQAVAKDPQFGRATPAGRWRRSRSAARTRPTSSGPRRCRSWTHFQQAVALILTGRAHAGWAVAAFTVGKTDEATEHWNKALS